MSADSTGRADGGSGGSGLELDSTGGGRELITAGQSLSDMHLGVLETLNVPGDGVDSVEVLWHVVSADTYMEFTAGTAGWQIAQVNGGAVTVLQSGADPAGVGAANAVLVDSNSGITVVTFNGSALPGVFDGSTGDVGVASNGADLSVLAVALSS